MNIREKEIYSFIQKGYKISTDSRNINNNTIFFALKGEVFDGNEFASEALDRGAALAVVDKEDLTKRDGLIIVKNVLSTLQTLATFHRSKINIPVIGITGSNGKTTTKELISSVLSAKYKILFTPGNYNNHIGLPLTILSIQNTHEIAVIEMGANHVGEIDQLCNIAQPTCGLITNIGKAHIEGFGSFENIIKGKSELYNYLIRNNGLIFVNKENKILTDQLKNYDNLFTYGSKNNLDCSGNVISSQPYLELEIDIPENQGSDKQKKISTNLVGAYNFENVMAAVAIGTYFNVSISDIKNAIENYEPLNRRSQFKQTSKNKVIWDAYNANPTSMALALENFANNPEKNKVAILGDMLELGDSANYEHQSIIDLLIHMKLDKVILIGSEFLACSVNDNNFITFLDTKEAADWFARNEIKNSTVFVKGSRGMQLEKLEKYL
ncbi:MAG: UDP-N-acetylmuramoyl-tripeptide--D-alanyl-D-alanine ligase [Bacteroidales bacterium]